MQYFINNKKFTNLVCILIFTIGFIARIYKFTTIPHGFNQDGAMAAVDALSLLNHGTDRFGMKFPVYFTAWTSSQMGVLMSYLMVPFIKIFGFNEFSATLPTLLSSLLGCFLLFKLADNIYGRKISLIVAFIVCINPWQIIQSRWALEANILPHFTLFGLYFLFKGLQKPIYLYLSMIIFGLTMYTYGIAFYTIPLLLLILSIYLIYKNAISIKNLLICILIYLIVAWPIFALMIINYFKLPTIYTPFITIAYFSESVRMNDLLISSEDIKSQLMINVLALLKLLSHQNDGYPWNMIKGYGMYYMYYLIFFLFGLLYLFAKKNKEEAELNEELNFKYIGNGIILIWFLIGVFDSIMLNSININRINMIHYPIIVITGIGIYGLVNYLNYKKVLYCSIILLYFVSFISFEKEYFTSYKDSISPYFYSGFKECFLIGNKGNFDKIYITNYTQSNYSNKVSEILVNFYAEHDSLYIQGKTNINKNVEQIPYNEKYEFVSFEETPVDTDFKEVYIFNKNEMEYFVDSDFKIMFYGGYGVAWRN